MGAKQTKLRWAHEMNEEDLKLLAKDVQEYVKHMVSTGHHTIRLFHTDRNNNWTLQRYSPVLKYVVDDRYWVFAWAPPPENLLASICSHVVDFPFTIIKTHDEVLLTRIYNINARHVFL